MLKGWSYSLGVSFHRRRLPHWDPERVPIFLTWRPQGSLPRNSWEGKRFLLMDRQLDAAHSGPTFLKHPRVPSAVAEILVTIGKKWKLYELFAWAIMSNHVHALLQPHKPLRRITHAIKSTSARQANLILGRTGQFWQNESYDHWVRDGKEFGRIVQYIEWNPVPADLVEQPVGWPCSSAAQVSEHESPFSAGILPWLPSLR